MGLPQRLQIREVGMGWYAVLDCIGVRCDGKRSASASRPFLDDGPPSAARPQPKHAALAGPVG